MDDTQQPFQQPEPVQQSEPVQKKKAGKTALVWVLSLLVLALAGVAYWQYSVANQAKNDKASADTRASTLQSKVTSLEAEVKTAATSQSATPTPAKTDVEIITAVVTLYVHGQKGNANAKVAVTIDKMELPFARANLDAYACIFKKVDGVWLQLYCGQGASDFTQAEDERYQVPSSIALQ